MTLHQAQNSPVAIRQARSLTQVLGQTERVKDVIEECAKELSSVNSLLKEEVASQNIQPGLDTAIKTSEIIEGKVQDAADTLALVNEALETEVQSRQDLEAQLAIVTEGEAAARHAALHDPLTGLPNRALFENRLELGLAQAKRHDRTMALMFMDLNEFKAINDVHGHDIGDAVLQGVAKRLKENTREDDTISRLGGDEFVYLLTEFSDLKDVVLVAEKLTNAIQAPCKATTGMLTIKASIGIATYPKDGSSASALIKSADDAMYKAKRSNLPYVFAG